MIRRLVEWLVVLMVINTVIWLTGLAITRSRTSKDLKAGDLEFYSFWNADEWRPLSSALRRVKARVTMAGATLDLRDSTPASTGLDVDVGTLMGGTAVLVRKDWDVHVHEETKGGEVEISLDEGEDLSEDAPTVTIDLRTTMGGGFVGYELPKEWEMS